jgi:hypothetical protein
MSDRKNIRENIGLFIEFIITLPFVMVSIASTIYIGWIILLFLIGSLFIPNLLTLSCIRGESYQFSCTLISSGIFGTNTTHIPSGQLQSTEVDKKCDGEDCSYEAIIKTTEGKISLFSYKNKFDAQEKIEGINLFIKNKEQKTLIYRRDNRWMIIYTVIIWGAFVFWWSKWSPFRIVRTIK